jgi:hypothetical protein
MSAKFSLTQLSPFLPLEITLPDVGQIGDIATIRRLCLADVTNLPPLP